MVLITPCKVDSSDFWKITSVLFAQGGNDHEIYESEQTVGHTGKLYDYLRFIYKYALYGNPLYLLNPNLNANKSIFMKPCWMVLKAI